jgi:hypothetical protein
MATKSAPKAAAKAAPKKAPATRGLVAAPRSNRAEERRWQAQDDLRTLQRAQEIQRDKSRMGLVQREARSQMEVLSKVAK